MSKVEEKAWQKTQYTYPETVPTMISREEKQYLYWLTKSLWMGMGSVVEIGPWLGGSTVCLAAGMKTSGNNTRNRLHVYDNFIWREFMSGRAQLPLESGDSFETFFLKNIKPYSEIVNHHVMALPDENIQGDFEAGKKRFVEDDRIPIIKKFSRRYS